MTCKLLFDQLHDKPNFSIIVPLAYTKVIKENPNVPIIIRHAEALKLCLETVPIIIRPDEMIIGTFDEKVPVVIPRPEATGLRIMSELDFLHRRAVNPINITEKDIKLMREDIEPFWRNNRIEDYARQHAPTKPFEVFYNGGSFVATEGGGIAHAVLDYANMLSIGLPKYLELTKERLLELEKDNKSEEKNNKILFYKSIRIILDALIEYSLKYAEKAESMARDESESIRKAELFKIAETCKNLTKQAPNNMQEAVQLVWFIHIAIHMENFEHGISFGRLDHHLLPYYKNNDSETLRLLKNLLQKTNEIMALYDSAATEFFGGMATTQGIVVGGVNRDGVDATNPLTYLILQALEENVLPTPNVVIRFHEKSPAELYQKVSNILSKGLNIIGLMYDPTVINGLTEYGITIEEARDYGVVGCVGLSTSGISFDNTGAVFFNLAKSLEVALGTDKRKVVNFLKTKPDPSSYETMDDLIETFKDVFKEMVEMSAITANAYQDAHKHLKPTPLMSLCIKGCFEQGMDVNLGPAKYNFTGIHVTGVVDVIDSLAAIDQAVFKEKKYTLMETINALKKNFRRNAELQTYLQNKCPKYGTDNEQVDKYGKLIGKILFDSVKGLKSARGGEYRMGIHAMTTNVGFGLNTGALPSGRKKGEPLVKDIAPSSIGEKGLTSAINSSTCLDHYLLGNGLACTLNITPDIIDMDGGKVLEALIKSYFEMGGLHLQFNAISPEMLYDAQDNPKNYGNLMIRVSGFSARFIDLSRMVQNEIIENYLYRNLS